MNIQLPFNLEGFHQMVARRIIVPLGPLKDGSEALCLSPRRLIWKETEVADLAKLMLPLTDVLLRRFASLRRVPL
jgi:hypothetical protein